MKQGNQDPGTAGANGVAQGNGATIHFENIRSAKQ